MKTESAAPHYTLAAGRCIVVDGVPFAALHGVGPYDPSALDTFARAMIHRCNAYPQSVVVLQRALAALRANGAPNCEAAKEILALLREFGEVKS